MKFNIKVNTQVNKGVFGSEDVKQKYSSDIQKLIINYLSNQLVNEQQHNHPNYSNTNINWIDDIKVDAHLKLKIRMGKFGMGEEEGEKSNQLLPSTKKRERNDDADYSEYMLCRDKPTRNRKLAWRYTPDNPQQKEIAEEIQKMREKEAFYKEIRDRKRKEKRDERLRLQQALDMSLNDTNHFRKGNTGKIFERKYCRLTNDEYQKLFNNEECPMCQEQYCGNDVVMTECKHHFDSDCLNEYITHYNGANCPICRHDYKYVTEYTLLEPEQEPEPAHEKVAYREIIELLDDDDEEEEDTEEDVVEVSKGRFIRYDKQN